LLKTTFSVKRVTNKIRIKIVRKIFQSPFKRNTRSTIPPLGRVAKKWHVKQKVTAYVPFCN